STRTDAQGRATVLLPNGRRNDARVVASADGFAPAVSAAPTETADGWTVAVALQRGGAVEGRVADRGGGPIAGANVTVDPIVGGRLLAKTDEEGHYRVDHLPVGPQRVHVSVAASGFAVAHRREALPAN